MNDRFSERTYRLDEDGLCRQLTSVVSPRMRDLLRIAMEVYVADRLTKRNGGADFGGPSRIMPSLTVHVSDPVFWNSPDVNSSIQRAINFLTDDYWEFRFEYLPPLPRQQFLLTPPSMENTIVCLYSGGLDSAAGLANRLREWGGDVIAVTAQHQAGQARLVRERQLPPLRKRFGNRVMSLMVRTALRNPPAMNQQELTQRGRSFLFAALGGAIAFETGVDSIEMYENGVGVVNLPPMTGMLVGGRTTKSAHPEFFRRMTDLLSRVADRPIEFVLPFRNKTKSQLVVALADDDVLTELARSSVSCVHYPRRVKGERKQCGVCPGCICRRQALISAGIQDHPDNYAFDIFGDQAVVESIPSDRLHHLKETIIQVESLSCVDIDRPLPEPVRTHFARLLESTEAKRSSIQVLQEYRKEWLPLIEDGLNNGRAWARWHGPIQSSSSRNVA